MSAGGRSMLELASLGAARDSSFALAGLVEAGPSGQRLQLRLQADAGPLFYYVTVTTAPRVAPVRPGDRGIQVERWYESYETGKPVTEIAEGALVRVRLKVTVPERPTVRRPRRCAPGRPRGGGSEPSHGRWSSRPRRSRLGCHRGGRATERRRALGLRELGCRLVVAVRSPGAARRPCGLRRHASLEGELQRHVSRPGHDSRQVRPPTGSRGGDVQPGGVRRERRRGVHGRQKAGSRK